MARRTTTVNLDVQAALLRQQVNLLRLEAGSRVDIINSLDAMMEELVGKLATKDLTKYSKARLASFIDSAANTIEGYYVDLNGALDKTLMGVASTTAKNTVGVLDATYIAIELDAGLPTEAVLSRIVGNALVMGAQTEEWWARQARDTAFRYANAVRQGIVAGDTMEGIVARVAGRQGYPGIAGISAANARSLVHSSIMEVANDARRETYQKNDDIIEGIRQVSTLDSHTTDICMAYDGAEFDLEGNPINGTTLPYESGCPRHWGCRSVEVPITKSFKELGIDEKEPTQGTRASEDGQVPASMTFEDFLDTHTKDEQDEMLGEGRADLWRDGKITLQDLLDQKGNPLTLEELERKYG